MVKLAPSRVQAVATTLEFLRQPHEERRNFGVLEDVELRDDVVAFFASADEIHHTVKMLVAEATGLRSSIAAFGEESSEEECVIADVLAHLALAVETRSWAIDRIGREQHLTHCGDWA